jgi:hypothetical protein
MAASVQTPVGRAPIMPVLLLGIGAYLAWFGVHYFGSDTKWPSDPVKNVLTGKPLPVPSGQQTAQAIASQVAQSSVSTTGLGPAATGPGVAAGGPAPAHSGTYTMTDLETLWASQGGSGQTAFEAANVAMAESSGRPAVTSANPDGGTNVGLWQLDTKGVGSGFTVAQLSDPATNARLTIMHTANGTNWAQWANSVVKNGVYVGPKV